MATRLLLLAAAGLLLAGVAGCGKQGDLARPAPLFGKAAASQDPSLQNRREEEGARITGPDNLGRPRDPGTAPPAAPVNVPPTER